MSRRSLFCPLYIPLQTDPVCMCVYLQHATCLEFFVSNFDTDQGLWAEVFFHTEILIWNFRAFPNYLENGHNIMLKLILRIYLNEWESIEENVMNMVAWPFLKMLTGVQTFHFKCRWWWWWSSSSSLLSMIIWWWYSMGTPTPPPWRNYTSSPASRLMT